MPPSKQETKKILKGLQEAYPHVKTQLRHENPFQLLMATILSAQCTDRQVNAVTPGLFKELNTPEAFATAPIDKIEKLVRSTGFYHNKARHLKACSQELLARHNGQVPKDMESLVALSGVGRKTANVVLGMAFGVPAMVVDTHVTRLSRRLGLSINKDPKKIEQDLMAVVPKKLWNDFSLWLIYHGRAICPARKPRCPECSLSRWCDHGQKRGLWEGDAK